MIGAWVSIRLAAAADLRLAGAGLEGRPESEQGGVAG